MSKLKDHPFPILLGIIASIIAILYTAFVFITGKPGLSAEEHQQQVVRMDSAAGLENSNHPHFTQGVPTVAQHGDTPAPAIDTPDNKLPLKPVGEVPKSGGAVTKKQAEATGCEINGMTYWSITWSNSYYIKFYDKSGNSYKFVMYESGEDIHGTATIKGNRISLKGNFGPGEVLLSNECMYLTGSISSNRESSFSMNYELK